MPTDPRLDALPDEVVSPITPAMLAGGRWWHEAALGPWPAALDRGLIEPRRGYRFRPENLALPLALGPTRARSVLDLGAGSGSLMILAALWLKAPLALGLELQPEAVERLRRTLRAYPEIDARVVQGDLRDPGCLRQLLDALGEPADVVVANPPFFQPGWGRSSRNDSVRLSTHAEHGDCGDFLAAARAACAPEGRILVVFDADHLAVLLARAGERDLRFVGLRWIPDQRPGKARQPFRVWVELTPGPGGAPLRRIDALPDHPHADSPPSST